MAALIGAGVLDRHPRLRLTSLECGHGWLAAWAARLDEFAEMSRHALPPLQRKPSVYIRGPQYFQSIQLYEGEQSLRHAIEALGEDTLMFATDYPHSESWFPKSVEILMGGQSISERARRKLLWENAERCYTLLRRADCPALVSQAPCAWRTRPGECRALARCGAADRKRYGAVLVFPRAPGVPKTAVRVARLGRTGSEVDHGDNARQQQPQQAQ